MKLIIESRPEKIRHSLFTIKARTVAAQKAIEYHSKTDESRLRMSTVYRHVSYSIIDRIQCDDTFTIFWVLTACSVFLDWLMAKKTCQIINEICSSFLYRRGRFDLFNAAQYRLDLCVDLLAVEHPELVEIGAGLEKVAGDPAHSSHRFIETHDLRVPDCHGAF